MANRTIANIIDFTQYLIRKERGIFLQPAQCTTNLDAAQLDAFNDYFRLYVEDQYLHDALKPFKKYTQFTTDTAGFLTYASDCEHVLGTIFTVSGSTLNEVRIYNEDEFITALNSQLRPVSLQKPIGRYTSTGVSIYPQSQQTGFYNYLKRPATPVYGYNQVGRVITYDPNTSIQLEWEDSYINNIISRSLKYVGINMEEKSISDFANQYSQENQ